MIRCYKFLFIFFIFISLKPEVVGLDTLSLKDKIEHYNYDSLFYDYGKYGYHAVVDEIEFYYNIIVSQQITTTEERNKELARIEAAAKQFRSDALKLEAEFFKTFCIIGELGSEIEEKKVKLYKKLAEKAKKAGDKAMQVRAMERVLFISRSNSFFYDAFEYMPYIVKQLDKISNEEAPLRRWTYYHVAEMYYIFKDYEDAIPLIRKSLNLPQYFFESSYSQSLNTMGLYYAMENKPDSSDFYFQSILKSDYQTRKKEIFKAIALANLGKNQVQRNNLDSAQLLFNASLKIFKELNTEYQFMSDIYAYKGEYYLKKNDITNAEMMIDSVKCYLDMAFLNYDFGMPVDALRNYYKLMGKYYSAVGNADLAAKYIDSIIVANKSYDDKFNAWVILRGKQEVFAHEKHMREQKLTNKNRLLIISFSSLSALILLCIFLINLYRKKQKAYKVLVQKSQQWAGIKKVDDDIGVYNEDNNTIDKKRQDGDIVIDNINKPDNADFAVMERIEQLMDEKKLYANSKFSLDILSAELGIDRRRISATINRCTKKHFAAYINEYRIKEAIRIMSEETGGKLSIDGIAFESGFNDRKTFHRVFKQVTGMTPAAFRLNV